MTAMGLKFDLDKKTRAKGKVWSIEECQDAVDKFKKSYPKLTRYLRYQVDFACKNGYVRNLFGRVRWLPNVNSKVDWRARGKDRNAAVNTPIQGASADLMLCALYEIWCNLDKEKARLLLTVHDSVVLEVRADYVHEAAKILLEALENPKFGGKPLAFLSIPIKADLEVGFNYGQHFEYSTKIDYEYAVTKGPDFINPRKLFSK